MDAEKRKVYDKYGEEGINEGRGAGGGGAGDIFDMMFGGGRGGGQQRQKAQVKPIVKQIEVTLEDVYLGKELTCNVERQRKCTKCKGVGGTDAAAVRTCDTCQGRGIRTVMMQLGPGMYTQSQKQCDDCNGEGEMIDASKRCKQCNGKKIKKDVAKLTTTLEKGMTHGEKIKLNGQGHEVPDDDVEAGDVIIQVVIKKTRHFPKKGWRSINEEANHSFGSTHWIQL